MASFIRENMVWPPMNMLRWKMQEHSSWYSGDPNVLANFYERMASTYSLSVEAPYHVHKESFWGRQLKNVVDIGVHVPIAGDIASTSADLIFSEPAQLKIAEAHIKNAPDSMVKTQEQLDYMMDDINFHQKLLEAGETSSAMSGVFIKLAWDEELSPYPIPVIEQVDTAYPIFRFGMLIEVSFVKQIDVDVLNESDHEKPASRDVFRLVETYYKDGSIGYRLFKGTPERIGVEVDLNYLDQTSDIENITTGIKDILAVYVPNILPNKMDRGSYMGRSDFLGIEGLMDSLDETYSSWLKDIILGQGRVMIPESFLKNKEGGGSKFNVDQLLYVDLDMDPLVEGNKITLQQFEIRAEQFEKTCLNLLDRIISSAGYSPQSFGLNIHGRAESGTALTIRERKSLSTKNKKQTYWEPALKKIVRLMLLVYKTQLRGKVEADFEVTIQFSDSITNDINQISEAVKAVSDASAISTETKVRWLHPDWSEDEVQAETKRILDETGQSPLMEPDQVGIGADVEEEEEEEETED